MKICKCGTEFEPATKHQWQCVKCRREYAKQWRTNNKDKTREYAKQKRQKHADKIRTYQREHRKTNREKFKELDLKARSKLNCYLAHIFTTAKCKSKHTCNITLEDIRVLWQKQNGLCAITGLQMHHKPNDLMSASLDRIDSSLDYTIDNIQLVCRWVNFAKSKYSNSTIKEILLEFIKHGSIA